MAFMEPIMRSRAKSDQSMNGAGRGHMKRSTRLCRAACGQAAGFAGGGAPGDLDGGVAEDCAQARPLPSPAATAAPDSRDSTQDTGSGDDLSLPFLQDGPLRDCDVATPSDAAIGEGRGTGRRYRVTVIACRLQSLSAKPRPPVNDGVQLPLDACTRRLRPVPSSRPPAPAIRIASVPGSGTAWLLRRLMLSSKVVRSSTLSLFGP